MKKFTNIIGTSHKKFVLDALAIGLIFITCSLAFFYRDFVKIKIGPIFILDFSFLIWALASFLVDTENFIKSFFQIKRIVFFTFWGFCLLFFDLTARRDLLFGFPPITTMDRIVQHLILFIYPLLWIWVGTWFSTLNTKWHQILVFSLLIAAGIANNRSTGPVLIIPAIYFLHLGFQKSQKQYLYLYIAFLIGFTACLPFWRMWLDSMQRTSLVLLFFMMLTTPMILLKELNIRSILRQILLIIICFAFFLAGIVGISIENWGYFNKSSKETPALSNQLETQFYQSLQHGDDRQYNAEDPRNKGAFQSRFRRFQWETAINDWKQSPLFGLGFIPEVPSYFQENLKNDGTYATNPEADTLGLKPVSGPHNSYLSILARMGIIGLLIFLIFSLDWIIRISKFFMSSQKSLYLVALILIPLNGAAYAFFNVAFESPHNCMITWIIVGLAYGLSQKEQKLCAVF